MKRERLDKVLVYRNLVESREKAQNLILSGVVYVNDQKVDKSNIKVYLDANIKIKQKEKFVSRGGYKLEKGIIKFQISIENFICLDIGASTGGFTDCLLQFGAKKVYAVDVGKNQLHEILKRKPNVISIEQVNARFLNETIIPEKIDFFTSDVSFISQTKIIPVLKPLLKPEALGIVLIKPQFELSKQEVKNGVVKSPSLHKKSIELVYENLLSCDYSVIDLDFSPLRGPKGNIEFLMLVSNFKKVSITKEKIEEVVFNAHQTLGRTL